jgi:hypothetical protein
MSGSTKSLLTWIVGVLVAAVIAILSVIFAMEVYFALQEPGERVGLIEMRPVQPRII